MSLTLRPFVASDFAAVSALHVPGFDTRDAAALYARHPSITLVEAGAPVLAMGVVIPWRGFGEAWFAADRARLARRAKSAFATAKRCLDSVIAARRLHRLQATVVEGDSAGMRFVFHLGFHVESKMPRCGPNRETFWRWVRYGVEP